VRASQFFAQEFLFPIASPFLCRFVARQLKTWNVFETIESPPWQQTTHYPVPRFLEKGNLGGGFFWGKQVSTRGLQKHRMSCLSNAKPEAQQITKGQHAGWPAANPSTHQPPETPFWKPPGIRTYRAYRALGSTRTRTPHHPTPSASLARCV